MHYVTWLGLWLKVKCLNREEFVVIGWTDPEGRRPYLGALLLGYYDPRRKAGLCRPGRHRRALGAARPGRRSQIPDLDRR
jgi:ATP-dependent DNA ligase